MTTLQIRLSRFTAGDVAPEGISPLRTMVLWSRMADAIPVAVWLKRSRSRRQLRELPVYLQRDIGLTEAQVLQESRKRFWEE